MKKQLAFYLEREKIINFIRKFFIGQGFHEVITPILNSSIPFEPNIYPFKTQWTTSRGCKEFYLPTSPEKNLKKMISIGMKNCFSIGHSFRNLEAAGSLHTPEFLMLEWYRENADYKIIMSDTKKLLSSLDVKFTEGWEIFSLEDLFNKYAKLELKEIIQNEQKLFDYAKKKGYQIEGSSWSELYDQIFVNEIEKKLPKKQCFIIDFPSRISPLCKPKKDKAYLAERFELYIDGIELANGNTENTDIQSVKSGLRKPLDREFLDSLRKMKNATYAGIGLGIDRLTMLISNHSSLDLH